MGKTQQLRRSVRVEVIGYSKLHPESFKAHMAASALLWLLAGREGLTPSEQLALTSQAAMVVTDLAEDDPASTQLATAAAQINALVTMVTDKVSAGQLLAEHAEDFSAWAAQLSEPEMPSAD